jgi:N utilization substance protein B
MISRRNIRVKVMQALYSVETQQDNVKPEESQSKLPKPASAKPSDPQKLLQKNFDQTRQLYVFLIHSLTEVARYAEIDSRNKAAKHLPSKADLNVNIKLVGNELLWKILESPSWQKAVKEDRPELLTNPDLLRKLYLQMVETERYQTYITAQSRDKKEEKAILEFIFNDLLLPSEDFTSYIEENFTNWDDDAEMLAQLVQNFLNKPHSFNFQELISNEKWRFGKSLLETVIEKKEFTMDLIKPKLKNWDPERIAVLDMLLMRMGVCEFLYFETIPPKVTINEYIDLAKEYSTPQSGQFVNGILDNIHKELVKDDKMHKVSFKPS